MGFLGFLLGATLWFTVPAYEADTLDCRLPWLSRPEKVATLRLYHSPCSAPSGRGDAVIRLLYSKPAQAGARDSFEVNADSCQSYFVAVVDSAGNESCWAGITLGIPPTSVGDPPAPAVFAAPGGAEPLYDLLGRRVSRPVRQGVYFTRSRRIVVVR